MLHYTSATKSRVARKPVRQPQGMTVAECCGENAITLVSFYYRLKEVRKVCLRELPAEAVVQNVVAVPVSMLPEAKLLALTIRMTAVWQSPVGGAGSIQQKPQLLRMVLQGMADGGY